MPQPEVKDPDVTRDVELGTATRDDFTAADTDPVAETTVEELRAALESKAAPTRRRAVLALAERDADAGLLDDLEAVARNDPDSEARQFAIEALARLGADTETIQLGLADDDPWVRAETIVWLKKTAPAESESVFEAHLDDTHQAVRRNALISLHHVRGSEAMAELEAGLDDEAERVREWAVRLLGTIERDDAAELIATAMETEERDIVREAAARALDGSTEVDPDPTPGGTTVRADDHVLNRMPDS